MNAKHFVVSWVYYTLVVLCASGCSFDNSEVLGNETGGSPVEDPSIYPNELVLAAFNKRYPGAINVEWKINGTYFVADFTQKSQSARAWFDEVGEWYQYKATISSNQVNQVVLDNLYDSEYGNWHINHADILERNYMGTVYIFDAENGSANYNLYYSYPGTFIKAVDADADTNETPVVVPSEIRQMLSDDYNGHQMYELMIDNYGAEVGIVEEELYKILVLDTSYDWLCTLWDLSEEMMPERVMKGFLNSKYAGYEVDKMKQMVKERNTKVDDFYLFYLTGDDKHGIVTFNKSGGVDIAIFT